MADDEPPAASLSAAPVLSTPAENTLFEDPTPPSEVRQGPRASDDELLDVYEVVRTAAHIRQQGWRRVALQFPDAMLPDAPRVVEAVTRELLLAETKGGEGGAQDKKAEPTASALPPPPPRLYILADTSYSACCVDEIAAEHADADAVVHYGRACLSPTARLPVLHVFTRQKLDYEAVAAAFEREFPPREEGGGDDSSAAAGDVKVVVMADVMFQEHVAPLCALLREKRGYTGVVATEIQRDPAATIPNRRLVVPATPGKEGNTTSEESPDSSSSPSSLQDHHLFHISTPPTALLLTLSSRLASLRIYDTPSSPYSSASHSAANQPDPSAAPALLRRRYGLVVRLATASTVGILVNTLSVRDHMTAISSLRRAIADAGKKSYTVVVGKLNAAKLANFAEMDGWVVVGCWESGLVDSSGEMGLWRPVVTPFEMGLALRGDGSRVWTGEWWGGIEGDGVREALAAEGDGDGDGGVKGVGEDAADISGGEEEDVEEVDGGVSDEESAPPEFDLRTGKLISNSRPMAPKNKKKLPVRNRSGDPPPAEAAPGGGGNNPEPTTALTRREGVAGEIATINGVVSPGAEFLRSQRTWQGLGTDFAAAADDGEEGEEPSTLVQEGRSGVARGYTVGEDGTRT